MITVSSLSNIGLSAPVGDHFPLFGMCNARICQKLIIEKNEEYIHFDQFYSSVHAKSQRMHLRMFTAEKMAKIISFIYDLYEIKMRR